MRMVLSPQERLAFFELTPTLAAGLPLPAGWVPLPSLPILIVVGVTGVGKSTMLALLQKQIGPSTLLPDRRELTDVLIISAMRAADGLAPEPVRDRAKRFETTRRFRDLYAGGMAHALTWLAVNPALARGLLIFDGLRGDNEIIHAAGSFPHARFVLLDARDSTRVTRLLGRQDSFDTITQGGQQTGAAVGFAALGLEDAAVLFTPAEQAMLLALVHSGRVSSDDLRSKVAIVAEERRSYDPEATRKALLGLPERALIVDTEQAAPPQVARTIAERLTEWALVSPAVQGRRP